MTERRKKILDYLLPSVGAMFVSYFYIVVDGMFIGQGVGPSALASVNLAVPFVDLLTAVAAMITMGGATITAIRMGRGDTDGANVSFRMSASLVVLISAAVTAVGVIFPHVLAQLFGATDTLIVETVNYIRWCSAFSIFFTLAIFMAAYVRNDGSPRLAFWGMVLGAIFNIFLDWVFVFPLGMGVTGAAVASGLGQISSCLILAMHFIRKRGILRFKWVWPKWDLGLKILRRGVPEFAVQMSMPITIFCLNSVSLRYLGEQGLSAFSVVSYIFTMMTGIFFGISQGLQPLISRSYGEENHENVRYYFRAGVGISFGCAGVLYGLLLVFGRGVIRAFVEDPAVIESAYTCLKIYGMAFLPAAVNIVFNTYFLSTKRTARALGVALTRGVVLNSACVFLLPMLFGPGAIWYSMVVAELATVGVAIALWRARAGDAAPNKISGKRPLRGV